VLALKDGMAQIAPNLFAKLLVMEMVFVSMELARASVDMKARPVLSEPTTFIASVVTSVLTSVRQVANLPLMSIFVVLERTVLWDALRSVSLVVSRVTMLCQIPLAPVILLTVRC